MPEANGYVLNVARGRRAVLLEAHQSGLTVAESVPEFTHSRSHPLVCFVGFQDASITHLALGRRGHRAGTGLRRLNLTDLSELPEPISHAAVLERIPNGFRSHVATCFTSGGLLTPGSFEAVVDALRDLLAGSSSILERFSATRRALIADLTPQAREALAYQKETVATAIELAGLNRGELQLWQPRLESGRPASFLAGLPQARLREDQMILNDLATFPGFDLVARMQHSSAVFANDRVTLTVVMANKLPLEQQLGADLIYCNETFGAFVIVQYKAMEQEFKGVRFRLPNRQLDEELKRMEAVWAELQKCADDTATSGFRLTPNPFFLKLCPRVVFDPDDASLIKGMYIPLGYWRRLEVDPNIRGRRNGHAISFDNVGRYFDNTSFAHLVAGGWIGTTTTQTAILGTAIREIVESGRTVTIAVKRDVERELHGEPDDDTIDEDDNQ
jgi:hypothetical protein